MCSGPASGGIYTIIGYRCRSTAKTHFSAKIFGAVLFAKEGADVSVVYLNEHRAAKETKRLAEEPGPIWTPLIPSIFPGEEVATFGADVPMKRAGQPDEVATCFVFLASDDSSYMTGQVLHPNGGTVVNG